MFEICKPTFLAGLVCTCVDVGIGVDLDKNKMIRK